MSALYQYAAAVVLATIGLAGAVGCAADAQSSTTPTIEHYEGDGHDHSQDGHHDGHDHDDRHHHDET